MNDRLAAAVDELGEFCPQLEEIIRVDVGDRGDLTLTARDGGRMRWFVLDDRGMIERHPERDPKLPLATRLRASDDWKVLSYRPGRRMVVLVSQGPRRNVIKGHKKSRSARAAVHQALAEKAMRHGAFRVPRLLQHDGAHEALLFEYLDAREVELGLASTPHYARLGAQLAVFQDDECAGDLKAFTPRDEFDVLERWRDKVLLATGTLPEGWTGAVERLRQDAEHLPPARLGLCHRDLHDRQVHLEGDDIAVLDFDLLCRADVALDAGNLVAHLRWRAAQELHGASEASARALERAFLEGLGRAQEPGFEARLAFYTAGTFLRLALVYRVRPRWAGRVSALVSWAAAMLDDLALES